MPKCKIAEEALCDSVYVCEMNGLTLVYLRDRKKVVNMATMRRISSFMIGRTIAIFLHLK